MRRMHFDDMVEGEQRERDPHRSRRRSPDFEDRESDDPYRQDYLQVDIVVRGHSDLAVDVLEEIHDRAGALRMASQELGLFLDPARKFVYFRSRRLIIARLMNVILEPAMEFVMPVDVVMHHHAAGRRVDGDPLDARYRCE